MPISMQNLSLVRLVSQVLAQLPAGVARPLRQIDDWRNRHVSRRALSHLDPHMLRDIGLTEHAVRDEVSKPFWRD